ncbi:hypothetical protein ES708_21340 [subsurface metagenome]
MYSEYKCFGCGKIFRAKKIPAICPVCQEEVSEVSEKKAWDRIIAKCERFVERFRGT